MEIETLKYFMELASGKTFWQVAEDNNISQSSVSKAVRHLEDELDVNLFDRQKRKAELSVAGKTLYIWLQRMEPEYKKVRTALSKYQKNTIINLLCVPKFSIIEVALLSRETKELIPYCDINYFSGRSIHYSTENIARALLEKTADFAICHYNHNLDQDFEYEVVKEDPLYVVLPQDHPLSQRCSVKFEDVKHEKLLQSSIIVNDVLRDISEYEKVPLPEHIEHFSFEVYSRDDILNMVKTHLGIALYFASDLKPFTLNGLSLIPIECQSYPLILCRLKDRDFSDQEEKAFQLIRKTAEINLSN